MDLIATATRRLASLPLRARRRGLKTLWTLAPAFRAQANLGLSPTFQRVLRLGRREAEKLDREVAFQDAITALEWLALLSRSNAESIADGERVEIDQPDVLTRAAASGKPVILAPLHMGNYVFGLAKVMKAHFPSRPMLILRAREDAHDDTRVMERIREIGADMRFLQVADKASYAEAVRFVRKGAVVIYFVDLPPSYGGPVDVTLFGEKMRLAFGIDGLARLADALVIPLSVETTLAADHVRVGRPFEVIDAGAAERARVLSLVTRHIEASVLSRPAQWHFWPRIDEFAAPDEDFAEDAA